MSEETPAGQINLDDRLELKKDFPAPTFQQWKEQAEKDLKSASYDRKLITKTYEGLNLNPIYTREDLQNSEIVDSMPGSGNLVRGSSIHGYQKRNWDVNQEFITEDVQEFNSSVLDALGKGQNCINLNLDTATKIGFDADYAKTEQVGDIGLSISAINSVKRALNGINLNNIPIYADTGFNNVPFLALIAAHCRSHNMDISKLSGAVTADPIAHLAVYGELPVNLKYIFDMAKNALDWTSKFAPDLRSISINTLPFANAGCSAVHELGISASILVYYIYELMDRGSKSEDIMNSILFTFGISTNYFMEIAKFRAAKILISNIIESYKIKTDTVNLKISAKSSTFYNTSLDPYVNMLRTATQTFSAILGGVDTITANPFDEVFRKSDSFSRRIARNTHIILREESHLDTVLDPGGGSYYIESLTEELARSAWEFFKKIEDVGGIFNALTSNFIQNSINDVREKRRADINKRKSVLVGTNMFADINEKKMEERKVDQAEFQKVRSEYLEKYRLNGTKEKHETVMEMLNSLSKSIDPEIINKSSEAYLIGSTLGEITSALNSAHKEEIKIAKLSSRRASEDFEELRKSSIEYQSESGSPPTVFLANYGSLRDFKARADFSIGFFEAGGFRLVDSEGSNSTNEIIKSALDSGAEAVAICSTDDNYPKIVNEITAGIKNSKPNTQVLLAGFPKDQIEEHKKSGVDDFIFLGADVMKILSDLLNKIRRDS